jgi:choline dehydrogenase-like flavoprotein
VTATIFEVDPSLANLDDVKTDAKLARSAMDQYTNSKSGPLTILPCSMCYLPFSHIVSADILSSMVSSLSPHSEADRIHHNRLSDPHKLGQIEYIFDLGNWSTSFEPDTTDGKKYGTILSILQYPFSKGSIHIQPFNAERKSHNLAINPQYYAGNQGHLDLEMMTYCQHFAEKICSTKPLSAIIKSRAFPAQSVPDEEVREWIVQNTVTDWHPVGTCAMGGKEDIKAGVVDERLKVYGVKGLRVVDASIMPLQISAHLQATIYAIAEKAAHMILEDLG